MSVTPNRGLPLMESSQAQPEVVYNSAMEILDVAVTLEVEQSGDSPGVRAVTKLKFIGATVAGADGVATVTVDATSGGGSLTVDALTSITQLTFSGPAVSVAAGGAGEAVVTIDTVSGGSGGSSNVTPDTHPASPAALNDEFEGVSLDGSWTWLDQGTSTAQIKDGHLVLVGRLDVGRGPSSGSRNASGIYKSLPGGSAWKIRAKFFNDVLTSPSDSGIFLYESSTGKLNTLCHYNSAGVLELAIISFTSTSAIAGVDNQSVSPFTWFKTELSMEGYFEIELASGTLHYRVSPRGVDGSFIEVYSQAVTGPFTSAPNKVGLYCESYNQTSPAVLYCDWIRDVT